MEQICCIFDLDGFAASSHHIDPKFSFCKDYLVREMAYIGVSRDHYSRPHSFRFDLSFCDLSAFPAAVQKTVHYQTRRITGLSFYPCTREPVVDYQLLPRVLELVYQRYRREEMNVMAYKGGHRERDLLRLLGIPSLDLSDFGCPKFDQLILTQQPIMNSPVEDCGYHQSHAANVAFHCPMAEVVAFRDWLVRRGRVY